MHAGMEHHAQDYTTNPRSHRYFHQSNLKILEILVPANQRHLHSPLQTLLMANFYHNPQNAVQSPENLVRKLQITGSWKMSRLTDFVVHAILRKGNNITPLIL